MSDSYPDVIDSLVRVELLQGILGDSTERRSIYSELSLPNESWVETAERTYRAMTHLSGIPASVGDQLLTELDVIRNADFFASIGGLDPDSLSRRPAVWWAPSARWFFEGPRLIEFADLQDPFGQDFQTVADMLLAEGASGLSDFFHLIAQQCNALLQDGILSRVARGFRMSEHRKEIAVIGEVARLRAILFRDGPNSEGRYLREPTFTVEEIRRGITDADGDRNDAPEAKGRKEERGSPAEM